MAKRQSRADRWQSAVSAAQDALERIQDSSQEMDFDEIESAASDFANAMQDLADVKQEYQDWYDNMPEGLQSSATGEKLEAIAQIDVEYVDVSMERIQDAIREALNEVTSEAADLISEAESAELPVGFGRD